MMQVEEWKKRATAQDVSIRRSALEELATQAELAAVRTSPGVSVCLVGLCDDPDETIRNAVTSLLEDWGPALIEDHEALLCLAQQRLTRHLENSASSDCAYWALKLVGRAAHSAGPVSRHLECFLECDVDAVQQEAIWALGMIGAAAHWSTRKLEQLTHSSSPRTARLATHALTNIRNEST